MKILLILSLNVFAAEHIRQNDTVKLLNVEKCLQEIDFFNSCDQVKLFTVTELSVIGEYTLVPKRHEKCEQVYIKQKDAENCLQVVHIVKTL